MLILTTTCLLLLFCSLSRSLRFFPSSSSRSGVFQPRLFHSGFRYLCGVHAACYYICNTTTSYRVLAFQLFCPAQRTVLYPRSQHKCMPVLAMLFRSPTMMCSSLPDGAYPPECMGSGSTALASASPFVLISGNWIKFTEYIRVTG